MIFLNLVVLFIVGCIYNFTKERGENVEKP